MIFYSRLQDGLIIVYKWQSGWPNYCLKVAFKMASTVVLNVASRWPDNCLNVAFKNDLKGCFECNLQDELKTI